MAIRLAILLLSIFFMIGFLIPSFLHYENKWKKRYSLRNMFPYELNYDANFLDNGWGNIFMILMSATLGVFFVVYSYDFDINLFLPSKIIGVLACTVIPFVVLIPLKHLRAHIAIVIAQFFTSMALPASIAISALRVYQSFDNSVVSIVVLVAAIIVTIGILFLVFNPKLSLRIMYDKNTDENGEIVLSRPKTIALAISEWIMIFSIIVDAVLLFVLMLVF